MKHYNKTFPACIPVKRMLMTISIMLFFINTATSQSLPSTDIQTLIRVNDAILKTTINFNRKLDATYVIFEHQYLFNKLKVEHIYKKVQIVRRDSREIIGYIEDIKATMIAKETGLSTVVADTIILKNIPSLDKYTQSTLYLLGNSSSGSSGVASLLKNKISEYRYKILEITDVKYRTALSENLGLNTTGPFYNQSHAKVSWEQYNFYQTSLISNIITLNSLILEVKNAEFDIIAQLYSEVSIEDFEFDKLDVKVMPESNSVLSGDTYRADIVLTATNSKLTPEIWIGSSVDTTTNMIVGEKFPVDVRNGVGKIEFPAGTPGIKKYGGILYATTPYGTKRSCSFSGEYYVNIPLAVVSPLKMNVLYIGVDNPIYIKMPNVSNDKLVVNIEGCLGTISNNKNGNYNVRVKEPGICYVTLSVSDNSEYKSMGKMEFRSKYIPDPIASVVGNKTGVMSKDILINTYILPVQEDFDFDAKFEITGFSLVTNYQDKLVTTTTEGNTFSDEMKKILSEAKSGQKVFIVDILAKGPGLTNRTLAPVYLTIE